jgi:AcrR family transcriptional regulator
MKRQKRKEETKERILMIASECFSEKGYDSTSVEEICKRSGISKGGFFHHFPTKQALFLEILNNWLSNLDKEMEKIIEESENVYIALIRLSGIMKKVLKDSYGHLPLFLEFLSKAEKDKEVWKEIISHFKRYREYFRELIKRGIEEGSINKSDPSILSQIIVSFSIGVLLQELLDPEGYNWEKISKKGIEFILSEVRK